MSMELNTPRALRHLTWSCRRRRHDGARFCRRLARAFCLLLFVALVALSVLYVRVTNPAYVRSLAEGFFARMAEADVTIGDARLSLFEGLQLDDVTIARKGGGANATVLTAARLQVSYSPLALLTGRLESGRILAIEPEVYLVEDVDTGKWNVEAMRRPSRATQPTAEPTTAPSRPMPLPEVLIRGGRVHRAEIEGGVFRELQVVRLEGQLLPRGGNYQFNLQARNERDAAGPTFQGEFSLANSAAISSLTRVDLTFLEPMLPARVRDFWQKLSPSGRVDVPVLSFHRGQDDRTGFRIELQLDDVKMIVRPTDWASAAERAMLSDTDAVQGAIARIPNTLLAQVGVTLQPALRVGEIPFEGVRGRFVFTEDGVTLDELDATVDGNPFVIRGRLGGYAIDAPLNLALASPADRPIQLRPNIPYMNALPAEIREVYYRFAPEGASRLAVEMTRSEYGGRVKATGMIEFANAQFTFQQFKYPVKNAGGRLVVDADPRTGELRLLIQDIKGTGPADGPNAKGELGVSGVIAPLIGYASVDVNVTGKDVHSEPLLVAALPPEAARVIAEFDDDGEGPNPVFRGDFACRVRREPGAISRWSYDTDVNIRNGRGALKAFPYPLEDLAVNVLIRKDHVQIASARSVHAGGTVEVSGITEWGKRVTGGRPLKVGESGVRTSLNLKARGVPIDDALRNALPADVRGVLDRFGVSGTIDATGPINVADARQPPQFDLTIEARDGRLAPTDWKTAIDKITATMQLTTKSLKLDRAVGKRGEATVIASGSADWTGSTPAIDINADVTNLTLDAELRDSLPPPARPVWDVLKPGGLTDASLKLTGTVDSPTWLLGLKPQGATLQPTFFALPMTELKGEIRATSSRVDVLSLAGKVASGTATISGVGEVGERQSWALKIGTEDTLIDRPFLDALPEALATTLIDTQAAGRADLVFDKLDWTTSPDGKSTDVTFDMAATLRDASWKTGIGFENVAGTIVLRGQLIDGEPSELTGDATLRTFRLAGIEARDGFAAITSDPKARSLMIKDLRAQIGQGDIAGAVTLDRSRTDDTRWSGNFLLRNADVASLTAASETKMSGQLNASLSLEGGWGSGADAAAISAAIPRRGRGDISVSGKQMVNVPMILGVTQVVSLALPFTGGFDEAMASYSLEGDRVSFTDISLQSNEMKIKGAGWLDFERRQVNLDFVTDSTGKNLPVIGNLLDAARRELFQIKVRGTLSEPTVKAGSLRTITTTVDEILKGDKE